MSRIGSYAITAGTLLLALLGCGGGGWSGADPITGITATNFKYGQLATLTLTGNALDNVIKLSSDKCISITLGAIESSSIRHATCIVAATGPIEFTVKSNADYTVYSTALAAPEPVTGISASNLKYGQTAVFTLSGDPQISALKVSSDKCTGMTLDAVSSAATRTARCTVTGTGDMKLTVTNTSGTSTFYTQTVAVPDPQVTLVTTLGTVVMELNPTAAPITVKNFLSYVNQSPSFYKDTLFHRVISGFMAQGGGFTTGMNQKPEAATGITLESQNGLLNVRGAVAMARKGPALGSPETDATKNSATSQFFVNLVDNSSLNYASTSKPGYAVFGKVISGMDVIDLMATKVTHTVVISPLIKYDDVPVTDITITSATQTQ
jgi:cyclophilin family peptidyl-prolyl cis-trans isomerase